MPTVLRDLVERTIRDSLPDLSSLDSDAAEYTNDHDADSSAPGSGASTPVPKSADEALLEREFVSLGFRKGHVSRALTHARSSVAPGAGLTALRHDVLSHLHLIVPESDLPASFRESRPADATIRNATARDAEELGRVWRAERVAREVGVPVEWVRREMDQAKDEAGEGVSDKALEGRVIDVLVRRLIDVPDEADVDERDKLSEDSLRAWWAAAGPSNLSGEEKDELRQRRDDELMGLEGLFGSRFKRTKDGIEVGIPRKGDAVSLRVLFHPASLYPTPHSPSMPVTLPSFYISSPTLPPYIRLHLLYLLASQFLPSTARDGAAWLDLAEGGYGGIVAEMVTFLEEHVGATIDNPPDAREVMDRLVPPTERPAALLASEASRRITKTQGQDARKGRRGRSLRATPEQQAALKKAYEQLTQSAGYQKMLEQRKRLPAWGMRERIVDLIRSSRVVIVCGETGSGKTTQGRFSTLLLSIPLLTLCTREVPAFVLEDAIMRGEGASTSIVVTQPRRVSAIGVASRVAAERCEDLSPSSSPLTNNLVGYAIRGERRASAGCRALFCTTGVVLARLGRGGDPDLEGVSHIFIDEVCTATGVHERTAKVSIYRCTSGASTRTFCFSSCGTFCDATRTSRSYSCVSLMLGNVLV